MGVWILLHSHNEEYRYVFSQTENKQVCLHQLSRPLLSRCTHFARNKLCCPRHSSLKPAACNSSMLEIQRAPGAVNPGLT